MVILTMNLAPPITALIRSWPIRCGSMCIGSLKHLSLPKPAHWPKDQLVRISSGLTALALFLGALAHALIWMTLASVAILLTPILLVVNWLYERKR